MEDDNKKPYKVKDVTRAIKKAVVAGTLEEVRAKAAEKFGRTELPNIHLDSDGTEVDDEDYFQTLEPNAELIAVFPGEQWIDPNPSEASVIVHIQGSPKTSSSSPSPSSKKDEEPSGEPHPATGHKHCLNPSEAKPSGSRDPSPKRPRGSRSAADKDEDEKLGKPVDEMVPVIAATEQVNDEEVVRSKKNGEDNTITVD